MYEINQQLIPEYQQLIAAAINHRTKVIPYSLSRNTLDCDDFGVFLSSKKYYNLVWTHPADKASLESIQGLLKALDDAEFIHHETVSVDYDSEDKSDG